MKLKIKVIEGNLLEETDEFWIRIEYNNKIYRGMLKREGR